MPGTVITFYSYKGGVGRSFAAANVATVLSEWGARVLLVDWDIEAPGLHHYFAQGALSPVPGVLGFLRDCEESAPRPWDQYCGKVSLPSLTGPLYLMPVADSASDYATQVQHLNWDELYEKHDFGAKIEELRAEWITNLDFILIDSRTGVTDFSGLTTAQLPDLLAFMFTANEQSLSGCIDVAKRATNARRKLPIDRGALRSIPIPARFEQREEYERAQHWRSIFAQRLTPFLDSWRPKESDVEKLISMLTIPYVPRWSFGEELCVLQEAAGSGGVRTHGQSVSYAVETLAALIAHETSKADLLLSSRDEFVHAARIAIQTAVKTRQRARPRIFISYSMDTEPVVRRLMDTMATFNIDVAASGSKGVGVELSRDLEEIDKSDAYVVLFGDESSSWQEREIDLMSRQSLRSERLRPILPIVLKGGEKQWESSRLGDRRALFLNPDDGGTLDDLVSPFVGQIFKLGK